MGRATRLVLLAGLALILQPASALAVDGDAETTFKVPLKANHGLSAVLEVDDDEVELKISKRGQWAVYFGRGEVSPERIDVDFGRLGEFVADYTPSRTLSEREPGRRCKGEPATTTEGFLRGTIRFRGERDYVRIEAARVKGTLEYRPRWVCDFGIGGGSAGASRVRAPAANEDEATLAVRSRDRSLALSVFGAEEKGERPFAYYLAFSQEVREGIGVTRLTFAGTRSRSFEFDNRLGTASVDPPAPFGGSASYRRRPGAPDRWSGTLTAPLLGKGRVRLAGPGFVARMVPGLPNLE